MDFAEISFINELKTYPKDELEGKCVRLCGSLQTHDYKRCRAQVRDICSQEVIDVDTSMIEPLEGSVGSLFQFIGEMDMLSEHCDMLLKAKIVRLVDGIDINLYKTAIEKQRNYLASKC